MPKRSGSSARGGRAAASVRRTRRKIDFSDIPDSSPEQLGAMRRVGRPPIGTEPRQLIAIRVDPGFRPEGAHGVSGRSDEWLPANSSYRRLPHSAAIFHI